MEASLTVSNAFESVNRVSSKTKRAGGEREKDIFGTEFNRIVEYKGGFSMSYAQFEAANIKCSYRLSGGT